MDAEIEYDVDAIARIERTRPAVAQGVAREGRQVGFVAAHDVVTGSLEIGDDVVGGTTI
jgi:hypothetical protein